MASWKRKWKHSVRDFKVVSWKNDNPEILEEVVKRHPMEIPNYYFNLIDSNDPNDPIRKLSYPNEFELNLDGSYDTSGENENTKMPGLQHKYKTTALVLTTNACFMYCRHCFRKRMVGISTDEINDRLIETVEYLKEHKEINNILLSGGDSFCLSNNQINDYLEQLTEIEHLDFIRFGTRAPVVFPERITSDSELIDMLKSYNKKKRIMIVTQFNHPRELTDEAAHSIQLLKEAGMSVNNQTVILKGVNDEPKVLAALLNNLNRLGVDPYYVFQCRPVTAVKTGFQKTLISSYRLLEETRPLLNGLSKRFRLIMSHKRGKIEIVGTHEDNMIFKFHQAKHGDDQERIFIVPILNEGQWLDDDLNMIE